jgi:hypothetical protein
MVKATFCFSDAVIQVASSSIVVRGFSARHCTNHFPPDEKKVLLSQYLFLCVGARGRLSSSIQSGACSQIVLLGIHVGIHRFVWWLIMTSVLTLGKNHFVVPFPFPRHKIKILVVAQQSTDSV